jgi:triosephosphate isomerase
MGAEFTSLYMWRPYKSLEEIKEGISKLESSKEESHSIQHAVPYTFLPELASSFPEIAFGAYSMNDIREKAFTRNIAAPLLHDVGAKFVLLGTNQSRKASSFDSPTLSLQIINASALQITPRLCIGENFSEYSEQQSKEILLTQLKEALENLNATTLLELIYEAPWIDAAPSIPTLESIHTAYQLCKTTLQELYPDSPFSQLKIFCKIPYDMIDVPDLQKLPVDGFYFSKTT